MRAMLGAHGVWQGEQFFGILDDGRLFFKVSESSRAPYIERGMEPFTHQSKGETVTLGFYEVPPDVLENAPELADWARKAIQVATAGKTRKMVNKAKSGAGKTGKCAASATVRWQVN